MGYHVDQHRLRQAPRSLGQVAEALLDSCHGRSMLTDVEDRFKMEKVTAVDVLLLHLCSAQ